MKKVNKEPAKVVDVPTEVANDGDEPVYIRNNFHIGQRVRILDEFIINSLHTIMDEDIVEELKRLEKDINIEIKKGLEGVIIDIVGKDLVIDFGKQYSFTNVISPIKAIFPDRKHYFYFHKSLCGYLNNEGNDGVVSFVKSINKELLIDKCYEYINIEQMCMNDELRIRELSDTINGKISDIMRNNIRKDMIKESLKSYNNIDDDETSLYVSKICKNESIKSIELTKYNSEECLLVSTNPLDYADTVKHHHSKNAFKISVDGCSMPIGEYKFLIFKKRKPIATSTTKFLGTGQHHPCVSSLFTVCMGSSFQNAYDTALKAGDIASCIHMMIDFLKDPNSSSPFTDATNMYLMQDIPQESLDKIKNNIDFFNGDFYMDLPFNKELYNETYERVESELKEREIGWPEE